MLAKVLAFSVCATKLFNSKDYNKRYYIVEGLCLVLLYNLWHVAHDSNRKNKAVPVFSVFQTLVEGGHNCFFFGSQKDSMQTSCYCI